MAPHLVAHATRPVLKRTGRATPREHAEFLFRLQKLGAGKAAAKTDEEWAQENPPGELVRSNVVTIRLLPRPVERHGSRRYSAFYLAIAAGDNGMRGRLDYLTIQHDTKTITAFMQAVCDLLARAATQPDDSVGSVIGTAPNHHRPGLRPSFPGA